MAANNESGVRRVIPRWRTFREALTNNELGTGINSKKRMIDGIEFVKEKERGWLTNKNLPFAIDLVSAATVLGTTQTSIEAANFVLENASKASVPAQKVARNLLGIKEEVQSPVIEQSRMHVVQAVKNLKAKRIAQPRNAFVWVDLARLYVLLGQNESARQALKVALMLAPTERFVLRSAARFFSHIREHDAAAELLRKNSKTPFDPWLIAAEIATSAAAEKKP